MKVMETSLKEKEGVFMILGFSLIVVMDVNDC